MLKKLLSRFKLKSARKNVESSHPELVPIFEAMKAKRDVCLQHSDMVETIFLGSSHVDYGFNPDFFSKTAFNLGSNSQDLYNSYCLYQFFAENLSHLKHIIIGVSVFSPGYELVRTKRNFICDSFHALYGFSYPDYKHDQNNLDACFKRMTLTASLKSNTNGFLNPPVIPDDATALADRAEGHLRENRRHPSQINTLQMLTDAARSSGYRVYFVTMPARSDYINALPMKSELFRDIYETAKSNSIKIFDLYSDKIFNDYDFYDFDHLNDYGAKKFTLRVKEMFS